MKTPQNKYNIKYFLYLKMNSTIKLEWIGYIKEFSGKKKR